MEHAEQGSTPVQGRSAELPLPGRPQHPPGPYRRFILLRPCIIRQPSHLQTLIPSNLIHLPILEHLTQQSVPLRVHNRR